MNIPFVDLKSQYESIKEEIDEAIGSVVRDTAFVRGPYVSAFEREYAEAYGVSNCVSVGNGTDAIYVALKALGIGPGDEVITTAMSWIATSEVITQAGARVVFADIDPEHYTIDVSKVAEKITEKTRAVIPVHLYGQSADMDRLSGLCRLCREHGLFMIEDCAQAHFAEYKGQKVGTFGDAGTFSFYPGKNLGAYGDAGAIITNDDDLADKMRMFANHGAMKKHFHKIEGINSRMDGIQGAVLSVKLKYIQKWNQQRYANAVYYNRLLGDIDEIEIPKIRKDSKHVFHVYAIRAQMRDELMKYLKEKGISTGIHYPTALPFLEAYEYLGHCPGDFPAVWQCQNEFLSLPMFPELSSDQMQYAADGIRQFYLEKRYEKLQNRQSSTDQLPESDSKTIRRGPDAVLS